MTEDSFRLQAAFEATRGGLVGRPWAVDDLDRTLQQWQHKQYRKAVLFVDNAGSDVILGARHSPSPNALPRHLDRIIANVQLIACCLCM